MAKSLFLQSLKVLQGRGKGTLFQVLCLEMKHPKIHVIIIFLFSVNNKLGIVYIKTARQNVKVEFVKMHCNNSFI